MSGKLAKRVFPLFGWMKILLGLVLACLLYVLHAFGYLSISEVVILAIWFACGFAAFHYLLKS